jgi:bifunctional UDP-N-acetylglucosamine pyrophosphorylase / glucosamine-1-phosphate N-acetyltransferase
MPQRTAIVLAAGEGTRMASATPKVLHRIAGQTLIGHAIAAVGNAGSDRLAVVVGPDRSDVAAEIRRLAPSAEIFIQTERRGTAHAVLAARAAVARGDDLLIVFGDTPLLRPETLRDLFASLNGAAIAVLGFHAADPSGYGRLIVERNELIAIREERDASAAEKAIALCNAGAMAIAGNHALTLLDRITDENAKREFYLTDIVALARAENLKIAVCEAAEEEVMGVNDKSQLAAAEAGMQNRLREAAMKAGATLVAPETVYLAADTKLARDVIVEPFVVFGPGVEVGEGAVIRSFSHLEGALVGAGASVGLSPASARERNSARAYASAISWKPRRPNSATRPRPIIFPMSATRSSARARISAPARSPAITTASTSTGRTSAMEPLSVRIRLWWRRSRSDTAPMLRRGP